MVDLVPDGGKAFAANLARVRFFTGMSSKMEFQVCFFRELSLAVLALVLFNFFLMILFLMDLKLLLISKNFFAARIFTGEAALKRMYLLCVSLQVLSKFERLAAVVILTKMFSLYLSTIITIPLRSDSSNELSYYHSLLIVSNNLRKGNAGLQSHISIKTVRKLTYH